MALFNRRAGKAVDTSARPSSHIEDCPCDQCILSDTHSNLLVFVRKDKEDVVLNAATMAAATGLARLGSTVCVINHPELTRGQIGVPLETSEKNLYGLVAGGKNKKDGGVDIEAKVLVDLCDKFDYVIMSDIDRTGTSSVAYDGGKWGLVAGRFILVNAKLDHSSPIASKSYAVVSIDQDDPIVLCINNAGLPEAYSQWGNNLAPDGLDMPLIAALWNGADPVPFAQAVIGAGDPLYYYADHRSRKTVIKTARAVETLKAGEVKAYSVSTVVTGAGAGWLLSMLYGQPMLVLIGLAFPLTVVGSTYVKTFLARYRVASTRAMEKRVVDNVYPSTTQAQIRLALAAPILGTDISSALYSSEMVWVKIRERHEEIKRRWNEYEMDITKMLDAPLITDYSCPQTAALVKAANKAKETLLAAEEGNTGRGIATTRGLYAEAVGELEIAFQVAEAHAVKQGIRGFAEAEQKKINRSRQLFALAADTGASDSERAQAIKQARKELDGIILIPERAVQNMLETTRLRPMLETA